MDRIGAFSSICFWCKGIDWLAPCQPVPSHHSHGLRQHNLAQMVFFGLSQNILAAVLTGMLGAKDPDQVNTMAKQAGEVTSNEIQNKI